MGDRLQTGRDIRILCQKNENSVHMICKFCAPFLQILRNISTRFFYGTIVCDTGVLSRVSWLVGRLKLAVTVQLTLNLRLLKMHCELTGGEPVLGGIEQIYFPYLSTNNRKFR